MYQVFVTHTSSLSLLIKIFVDNLFIIKIIFTNFIYKILCSAKNMPNTLYEKGPNFIGLVVGKGPNVNKVRKSIREKGPAV